MRTNRIAEKIKHYPIVFLGLLVSLVLIGLIHLDKIILPELKSDLQTLTQERRIMDYNAINSVRFNENLQQLQRINQRINDRLIDPNDPDSNYQYFSGLGEETGVKVKDSRQVLVAPIPQKKSVPAE